MQHDWIKSTLGHGEAMCSRCFVTNREAAAIGMVECDVPPPAPKSCNDNVVVLPVVRVERFEDDERDDLEEDGPYPEEDCGRWDNGRLMKQCRKVGSEECDWE